MINCFLIINHVFVYVFIIISYWYMMFDLDDVDIEVIMPTNLTKYYGHIKYQKHRFYAYFCPPYQNRKDRIRKPEKFKTYKEAFSYIKKQNRKEGNIRVKNIIYRKGDQHECTLTKGKRMKFSLRDIDIVHKYTWSCSNDYVGSKIKGKKVYFHCLIFNKKKDDNKKWDVDHKNRKGSD